MDRVDAPDTWAEDLRAWANDCWAQAASHIEAAAEAFARLAVELEAKAEQMTLPRGSAHGT